MKQALEIEPTKVDVKKAAREELSRQSKKMELKREKHERKAKEAEERRKFVKPWSNEASDRKGANKAAETKKAVEARKAIQVRKSLVTKKFSQVKVTAQIVKRNSTEVKQNLRLKIAKHNEIVKQGESEDVDARDQKSVDCKSTKVINKYDISKKNNQKIMKSVEKKLEEHRVKSTNKSAYALISNKSESPQVINKPATTLISNKSESPQVINRMEMGQGDNIEKCKKVVNKIKTKQFLNNCDIKQIVKNIYTKRINFGVLVKKAILRQNSGKNGVNADVTKMSVNQVAGIGDLLNKSKIKQLVKKIMARNRFRRYDNKFSNKKIKEKLLLKKIVTKNIIKNLLPKNIITQTGQKNVEKMRPKESNKGSKDISRKKIDRNQDEGKMNILEQEQTNLKKTLNSKLPLLKYSKTRPSDPIELPTRRCTPKSLVGVTDVMKKIANKVFASFSAKDLADTLIHLDELFALKPDDHKVIINYAICKPLLLKSVHSLFRCI